MTAASVYSVNNNFGVPGGFNGNAVGLILSLSRSITDALFDVIRQESIEIEVGFQVDKVFNSINEQLLLASLQLKDSLVSVGNANKLFVEGINRGLYASREAADGLSQSGETLLILLDNTVQAVSGVIQKLEQSNINRSCFGETLGHLYGISEMLIELASLVEETSFNVRLSVALQDKPMNTSANPRLNALLG